jgi:UDP-galactose transporter
MNGVVECKTCGSKARQVSVAYDRQRSIKQSKWKARNVLLVLGDCTLIALQPILVYISKVDGKFLFSPVSVNFLTEFMKVVFAIGMLLWQARQQRPGERSLLSPSVILTAARKNYLLAVPACLYAINNYLKFIMQLYFNPATVKMLSNLKVLVIALLLKAVMKRRFTVMQWEALTLLLIGISVNQLHTTKEGATALAVPIASVAYFYTLVFVTVPSLASVYNEYALKSQFDTSVHLQNLFLYAYGAMFNFVAIVGTTIYQGGAGFNIFEGHSKATMFLIINNAAQGILSSFFYKYADTILKKYSSTVATIFTGLASAALFGHALTINFVLGVTIVFISMHQFFSSVSKPQVEEASYTHLEPLGRKLDKKDSSLDDLASVAHQEGSHTISVRSEREPLLPK